MVITLDIPVPRCTPENIQIISINTEDEGSEGISRVTLNNNQQRVKPAIPDKPKDISHTVRNILKKKEAGQNDKQIMFKPKDKSFHLQIPPQKRVSSNINLI